MRITSRQLRQIIREELFREQTEAGTASTVGSTAGGTPTSSASESSNKVEGKTYQIDASGKAVEEGKETYGGLSIKLEAIGLIEPEVAAMKKKHAVEGDFKYYLSFTNNASVPVVMYAARIPGYASGAEVSGKFEPRTTRGFIGMPADTDGGPPPITLGAATYENSGFWSQGSLLLTPVDIEEKAKAMLEGEKPFAAVLIKLVTGVGRESSGAVGSVRTEALKAWRAAAAKNPIKMGAAGDNVKEAQILLTNVLMGNVNVAKVTSEDKKSLNKLKSDGKITGTLDDVASLTKGLADAIKKSGPDGKFGPMTHLATRIFQSITDLKVDGAIGKDTANILGATLDESVRPDQIIARWSKLAGLLEA